MRDAFIISRGCGRDLRLVFAAACRLDWIDGIRAEGAAQELPACAKQGQPDHGVWSASHDEPHLRYCNNLLAVVPALVLVLLPLHSICVH